MVWVGEEGSDSFPVGLVSLAVWFCPRVWQPITQDEVGSFCWFVRSSHQIPLNPKDSLSCIVFGSESFYSPVKSYGVC